MIVGIITQYNNEIDENDDETETITEAGQSHFDSF